MCKDNRQLNHIEIVKNGWIGLAFVGLFVGFFPFNSMAVLNCSSLFLTDSSSPKAFSVRISNQTYQFNSYIKELFESRIISVEDLFRFQVNLNENKIVNLIPHEISPAGFFFTSSKHQIHYEALEQMIQAGGLDKLQIKVWVEGLLKKQKRADEDRSNTQNETQEMHQKMEFYRFESGKFWMKETYGRKRRAVLEKPFEIMSTMVTQKHWALIMVENPSYFKSGIETLEINVNGKLIKVQPNHPVDSVSWEDVQIFISKLNKLSQKGDSLLEQIIPDFKKGDVFRLPTEAEWEYVARSQGLQNEKLPSEINESDVHDYAWLADNAQFSTHPVGQRKPIISNKHEIFDLVGNLFEWTNDGFVEKPNYKKSLSDNNNKIKTTKGGSWMTVGASVGVGSRLEVSQSSRLNFVGFRLVREVNEPLDGGQ